MTIDALPNDDTEYCTIATILESVVAILTSNLCFSSARACYDTLVLICWRRVVVTTANAY